MMEPGIIIDEKVDKIFDEMLSSSSESKVIKKIINSLREIALSSTYNQEKLLLTIDNITAEVLIQILGEDFFDDIDETIDNLSDFIIIFNSQVNKEKELIVKKTGKKNLSIEKTDIRSIKMEVSDDLLSLLNQMSLKNDEVCLAFLNFIEHEQAEPGKNVLSIKYLDVDKDNSSFFKATLIGGNKVKITTFNFIKKYFGYKFSNFRIDEFCDEFKKLVDALLYEPGDVVELDEYKFNPRNIRSTFLSLVTETYPRGYESQVAKYLGPDIVKDRWGNYFTVIGDSDCMFTCHLDTASKKSRINLMSRTKEGQEIVSSDGTTILGGDDKAGVTILLFMIANKVPGVYYFFIGEEAGGIGSNEVATNIKKITHLRKIRKCISFDRRNYYSVITTQLWQKCCSDIFAKSLCDELNKTGLKMKPDPTGIFSDSANFMDLIPECTNISVGYLNEHTKRETQNLTFLERLAEACIRVNWTELPVERKPHESKKVYDSWNKIISAIEESGIRNTITFTGDEKKLIIHLDIGDTAFDDAHIDLLNLEYIFKEFQIDPVLSFEQSFIKFEVK